MRKIDIVGRTCVVVSALTLGYSALKYWDTYDEIKTIEQRVEKENNLENQTRRGDLYKEHRDYYRFLLAGMGLSTIGFALKDKRKQ